jgi:ATP-binding cassette, subfamily F, member 3
MFIVKVDGLKKMFGSRILFDQVSVGIREGERIGLIGANGVGKTTFLNILYGMEQPDAGEIRWKAGFTKDKIGFLSQQIRFTAGDTIKDFVQRANTKLFEIEKQLRTIEKNLATGSIQQQQDVLQTYGYLQEQFEQLDGYNLEYKVEKVLKEVNLDAHLWDHDIASLSGGQKTKAQLARILLQQPEFLLLDEPTNHLDQETMLWMRNILNNYPGTILIVSHDRHFLDQVATSILELSASGMSSYSGNYSDYKRTRELKIRTQQALYQKQQTQIRQLEEAIRTYQSWYQRAHKAAGQNDFARSAAKAHVTRLHNKERQLERIRSQQVKAPRQASVLSVQYDTKDKLGSHLLHVEQLAMQYGQQTLFKNVSFTIQRGAKIALIGSNGVGKSTLLQILLSLKQPTEGSVYINPGIRIGYFVQELDHLDPDKTILEEVQQIEGVGVAHARTILACFLFKEEDVFKPIGSLSQGEKCRVAFVKLYFSGANLLILDEPTNYLDIPSREQIERALQHFPGTILLVSHDQYMVERIATELLLFQEETVRHFKGTYKEWIEFKTKQLYAPEELQVIEQKTLLQMELSKLSDVAKNPLTSKEEQDSARQQLDLILNQLKALNRSMHPES